MYVYVCYAVVVRVSVFFSLSCTHIQHVHVHEMYVSCTTWFSRPGSCLLCFLLFSYCVFLFFTAFALGLLVFLTSLGLSVFLTFAVTFKKPLFVWRKLLHQAFWSF